MVEGKERGRGKPRPYIFEALDPFHRMAEMLTRHPKLITLYQLVFNARLLLAHVLRFPL